MQLHVANIGGELKQVPIKTASNKVGWGESVNGNVKSSVANVNAKSFSGAPNGFGNTGGADEFCIASPTIICDGAVSVLEFKSSMTTSFNH